jgi:hypothetical protein
MKKMTATLEKLMAQRKAIDTKITKIKEEEKAEKRATILKAIEASGLAELEDAELRQALAELMAAHTSKKTIQPAPPEDQKTAP